MILKIFKFGRKSRKNKQKSYYKEDCDQQENFLKLLPPLSLLLSLTSTFSLLPTHSFTLTPLSFSLQLFQSHSLSPICSHTTLTSLSHSHPTHFLTTRSFLPHSLSPLALTSTFSLQPQPLSHLTHSYTLFLPLYHSKSLSIPIAFTSTCSPTPLSPLHSLLLPHPHIFPFPLSYTLSLLLFTPTFSHTCSLLHSYPALTTTF